MTSIIASAIANGVYSLAQGPPDEQIFRIRVVDGNMWRTHVSDPKIITKAVITGNPNTNIIKAIRRSFNIFTNLNSMKIEITGSNNPSLQDEGSLSKKENRNISISDLIPTDLDCLEIKYNFGANELTALLERLKGSLLSLSICNCSIDPQNQLVIGSCLQVLELKDIKGIESGLLRESITNIFGSNLESLSISAEFNPIIMPILHSLESLLSIAIRVQQQNDALALIDYLKQNPPIQRLCVMATDGNPIVEVLPETNISIFQIHASSIDEELLVKSMGNLVNLNVHLCRLNGRLLFESLKTNNRLKILGLGFSENTTHLSELKDTIINALKVNTTLEYLSVRQSSDVNESILAGLFSNRTVKEVLIAGQMTEEGINIAKCLLDTNPQLEISNPALKGYYRCGGEEVC